MNTSAPPSICAALEGATRTYTRGDLSVPALDRVDLSIGQGEFVALVGPSGCGKSTLLNLLGAVDRADGGRVDVLGHDLVKATEAELTLVRRRRIGVVFQDFQLMPNLTAQENVALPLALDARSDDDRVRALLARVGLDARRAHFPSELSGGEQQRVAIARALVHAPQLVVADEPTGNLDSVNGAAVLELLEEVRREAGCTLVMATHDADIAAGADRVVRLRDGRIVATEA